MGLDTKTYWLTDRQSQCDFDFDFEFEQKPCGGGVEYLHRDPASRRRRRKGKSQIWDNKIWSRLPRDSDPRKTALTRASSIYKRQTRPLVREGAPQKKTRPQLSNSNKCLDMSLRWGSTPRLTGWHRQSQCDFDFNSFSLEVSKGIQRHPSQT
jgi:hypothetical protein